MKTCFELASVHVFRLLAEKALSQVSTAKNSEEEADAEDDRVSIQEAMESSGEAEDDEGPGDEAVHQLFPSSLGRARSLAKHRPIHVRTKLFTANAGQLLYVGAVVGRNPVLRPLVNDTVAAQVETLGHLGDASSGLDGSLKG